MTTQNIHHHSRRQTNKKNGPKSVAFMIDGTVQPNSSLPKVTHCLSSLVHLGCIIHPKPHVRLMITNMCILTAGHTFLLTAEENDEGQSLNEAF